MLESDPFKCPRCQGTGEVQGPSCTSMVCPVCGGEPFWRPNCLCGELGVVRLLFGGPGYKRRVYCVECVKGFGLVSRHDAVFIAEFQNGQWLSVKDRERGAQATSIFLT